MHPVRSHPSLHHGPYLSPVSAWPFEHETLALSSPGPRREGELMECVMISLEDCIAICGLEAIEVQAIAEHEHIPEISAAALADYLLHQVGGAKRIRKMILDDIRTAVEAGRGDHATELSIALHHFLERHPEA